MRFCRLRFESQLSPPAFAQRLSVDRSKPRSLPVTQGSQLIRNAFFDAPFLVATLNVVKNYALAGDAAHGAIFVQYTVSASFKHQP